MQGVERYYAPATQQICHSPHSTSCGGTTPSPTYAKEASAPPIPPCCHGISLSLSKSFSPRGIKDTGRWEAIESLVFPGFRRGTTTTVPQDSGTQAAKTLRLINARKQERNCQLALTTRTGIGSEGGGAAFRFMQPQASHNSPHENCAAKRERHPSPSMSRSFNCETSWVSYSIVSFLLLTLPLDRAIPVWATSWWLYLLTALFNGEPPLGDSTSWLLYHLTELPLDCAIPIVRNYRSF